MALPYDLYIRFLVTKGIDELAALNANLDDLNLHEADMADLDPALDFVEKSLPKTVLAQIEKKSYSADFLPWMGKIGVRGFWELEAPFCRSQAGRAFRQLIDDIHADPVVRITINGLLIKGVAPKDIYPLLASKYSSLLKEEHVTLYSDFFFNPKRMRRRDWREYLKFCNSFEQRIYFTALTEPLDVLKTELGLPAKIAVSEMLQGLLSKSYLKARDALDTNTPEANQEARRWMDQVVKLTDKYEKYRSADREDFATSLQMEFEFTDAPFEEPDSDVMREVAEKNRVEQEASDKTAELAGLEEVSQPDATP